MGGAVVFVWHHILEALSTSAIYLLMAGKITLIIIIIIQFHLLQGGAAYIFGIIFFIWGMSRPIYHSIWHLFVVLGIFSFLS